MIKLRPQNKLFKTLCSWPEEAKELKIFAS